MALQTRSHAKSIPESILVIMINTDYMYNIQAKVEIQDKAEVEAKADPIRLAHAKLQEDAKSCALKLMTCLFTTSELVNGNPSGNTNSKDESRKDTIVALNPAKLKYIYGMWISLLYHILSCKFDILVQNVSQSIYCIHAYSIRSYTKSRI